MNSWVLSRAPLIVTKPSFLESFVNEAENKAKEELKRNDLDDTSRNILNSILIYAEKYKKAKAVND